MKKIKHSSNIILAIAVLQMLLTSCSNYYKAISSPVKTDADKAAKIDSLRNANRTFILRNGEQAFLMEDVIVNTSENTVGCRLDTLAVFNKLHLSNGRGGKMRYKKYYAEDMAVLAEVHIYIDPDATIATGKQNFAISKVKKIEVIERDKKRTSNSYLLGGLGIAVVLGVILVAIASASVSSMSLGGF